MTFGCSRFCKPRTLHGHSEQTICARSPQKDDSRFLRLCDVGAPGKGYPQRLTELRGGLCSHRSNCTRMAADSGKHPWESSPVWDSEGLQSNFSARSLQAFALGVVGDIHLEPDQMHLFYKARDQLHTSLQSKLVQASSRLVQLGDLGGYNHDPGGMECLQVAKNYLDSFQMPFTTVAGNHDLEGEEFETDEENLQAWQQAFKQRHYWSARLGGIILLGLSTVKFRSNKDSVHEVHIDQEQIDWFRSQLRAADGAPIVVFTHAPPMGCGLKVVEAVHVRNRCAWLNHSSNPEIFADLVDQYPNIRLWFSGHYHLSQNYKDSIAVRNNCSFVQVGVIGDCGRDGQHQSRILRGDQSGFKLSTFDHATGSERLDLSEEWTDKASSSGAEQPSWPLSLSRGSKGANGQRDLLNGSPNLDEWHVAGGNCLLRRMDNLLVEYNATYQAAVGVVFTDIDPDHEVRLVDAQGEIVESRMSSASTQQDHDKEVIEIHITDKGGHTQRKAGRNEEGTFFRIFQQNKWRAKQEEKQKHLASV